MRKNIEKNMESKLLAAKQCDELTNGIKKMSLNTPNAVVVEDIRRIDPQTLNNYTEGIFPRINIPTPETNKCAMAGDVAITIESSQAEKEASPVGLRFNEGKVRWDLIDPTAVEGVAAVLAFGCKKYTAENWRKGLSWKSTLRSLESHLQALKRGEDIDPESGLPHIDHLGCNWMFFSNYQKTGIGEDDRVKAMSTTHKELYGEKADKLIYERKREWERQAS